MQLLPGVKSAGEGNAGYYVRGGGSDQNLILLDEAPVYNSSHLFGFFSVFNPDAVKDVKLIEMSCIFIIYYIKFNFFTICRVPPEVSYRSQIHRGMRKQKATIATLSM